MATVTGTTTGTEAETEAETEFQEVTSLLLQVMVHL